MSYARINYIYLIKPSDVSRVVNVKKIQVSLRELVFRPAK